MKRQKVIICSLLIVAIILLVMAIFIFMDIQTKIPETIQNKYELEIHEFSNRKVFTIHPKHGKKDKYVLYFHGGAYMAEIEKYHWSFLERIIECTGYSIIVPDYPLTPKYNYKDVFEMVLPMYKEIIKDVPPENIVMMGDSAGGGLALALEEKLGEEEIDIPSQLILISPWLDITVSNPEIEQVQIYDKDLNKEALKVAGIAYSGANGMDNYLVSPINGPINKLKNVTIFTGTYDILNPEARLFVEQSKNKGVDINLKEYDKGTHIWILKEKSELAQKGFEDLILQLKIDTYK